jgi:hypothetical protein
MPDNKPELLMISRLLTPKCRADLLAWVRLAYAAENSMRKSLGFTVMGDETPSLKSQEYPCENLLQRSEK